MRYWSSGFDMAAAWPPSRHFMYAILKDGTTYEVAKIAAMLPPTVIASVTHRSDRQPPYSHASPKMGSWRNAM